MKHLLIATLLVPLGTIFGDEGTQAKDGLWSIHTQFTEHPSEMKAETDTSYCRNHSRDEREMETTKQGSNCKIIGDRTSGGTRVKETECPVMNGVIRTKMTITMISDSTKHTETITVFDPPSAGRTGTAIITDQKYVGACPAGIMPGDLLDAKGKVIHHGKP
jgi:hypothetical protein